MLDSRQAVNSLRGILALAPMRHAGVLFLGKGTQGLFSLIYLMLAARTLGPANFGILMLVHRFTLGIAQLVNFQSWQALVRYGAEATLAADRPRFARLLAFCLRVDAIGALIALLVILFAMPLAGELFDLPESIMPLARLYGIAVVPIIFSSTSLGVLRLFQRFDLLAAQVAVSPVVRLVGTLILWQMDAGLTAFLWLWLLSNAAGRIAQTIWAWRELAKRQLKADWRGIFRLRDTPERGLWRFTLGTNAGGTLDLVNTQAGILAVGWVLGPVGAGLYSVAQQLSDVLIKPNTKLLVPAIYPELAKLTAKGERAERTKVVSGMAWIAGGLSLLLLVILFFFGQAIIARCFGPDYVGAYWPTIWMAIAGVLGALSFPLEPLLMATGKVRQAVLARLAGVIVYVALLYLLLPTMGLIGAALASLAYAALAGLLFLLAGRIDLAKQP